MLPKRPVVVAAERSPDSNRRVAPRLTPDDVPWITSITPNLVGVAELVNISKTGVLLDTKERLLPGRHTTLVARADDGRTQRIPGVVVRTEIVSIKTKGVPVYRTALMFEGDLAWDLDVAPVSQAEKEPSESPDPVATERANGPYFEGPIEGLFSTQSGAEMVAVSTLSETGCEVRTTAGVAVGDWVSITVFFSPVRRLLLTARVASFTPAMACVLRFARLTVADRRHLRVEILGVPHGPRTPIASRSTRSLVTDRAALLLRDIESGSPQPPSLPSNQW